MQAAQRAEANPALQHAVRLANEQRRPWPGLDDRALGQRLPLSLHARGPSGNAAGPADRGVCPVVRRIQPDRGAVELGRAASLVVTDRGYLRIQKSWRERAATALACPLIQVETETVVPVEKASTKEEYSAATFRPKIRKILASSLAVPADRKPLRDSLGWKGDSIDLENIEDVLAGLKIDRSVGPSPFYRGGTEEAKRRFRLFLRDRLDHFADLRNNPTVDFLSHLSPYLHFGQISPVWAAAKAAASKSRGREAFLEEPGRPAGAWP